MPTAFDDYTLRLAKKHVDAFDALMELHREAMRCRECEELLAAGISAYEYLSRADETIRKAAIEGLEVSQDVVDALASLYRAWLRPCPYAEEQIRTQLAVGYPIENLEQFRKAQAAVEQKVRVLGMEEHLEDAFRGAVFDAPFWSEAHRIRSR